MKNETFADRVIELNQKLTYSGLLPAGYKILNPFLDNPETFIVMCAFYKKYYNDNNKRKLIVGINPGRFGAGLTGVPFTDTKHLKSHCGIEMKSAHSHETSGLFVYDLIETFGGVEKFYAQFYINNAFPLAITHQNKKEKWVNANYYDEKPLIEMVNARIIEHLKKSIKLGLDDTVVFVLGKRNAKFVEQINQKEHLFQRVEVLEHPRYIQQYKTKEKGFYIDKYLQVLNG